MDKLVLLRRRRLGATSCRGMSAHSQTGIRVARNWMDGDTPPAEDEVVVRWGCTSNIEGIRVINTAVAIHQVSDKRGFRMLLNNYFHNSSANPQLCPDTWDNIDDVPVHVIEHNGVIVRPATHSRGRNLYYCKTPHELINAVNRVGANYYIGEYIPKVAEYRVYVVQGRAVAVAKKIPEDSSAVAWNHALGASVFENVRWDDWPLKAVRISIEAFNLSLLDFGGVDVMVDADGGCTVLEINSAPTLTSEYRQECFAKAFDYIAEHGKERMSLIDERGGYRKFIHPSVCDRAVMV